MRKKPSEIKMCPHCKQAGELKSKDKGEWYEKFWVQCWVCGARGGVRNEPEDAIEAWNMRAYDETDTETDITARRN